LGLYPVPVINTAKATITNVLDNTVSEQPVTQLKEGGNHDSQ
jgi:hypothetical protein